MKMRLTFILLILAPIVHGQSDSLGDNRLCLKVTPLALIDVFGGNSYRIGSEFKLVENLALSLEYGRYFSYKAKGLIEPLKIDTKGDIIRAELKIYRNEDGKAIGKFYSLEYLYKNITFNYLDSIRIKPDPAYQKEYTITKEISCISFKWGDLKEYNDRLLFEWYAGVGLRFYTCGHNTLTPEERSGLLTGEGHGDLIGGSQRQNSPFWFINLNAGIKIGLKVL